MNNLKNYLQMDISLMMRKNPKKLSLKKQVKLIQLMNNLFSSGFSLTEIVNFLSKSGLVEQGFTQVMHKDLTEGKNLSEILDHLGFSKNVVTQVTLADYHGNIEQSLNLIEINLRKILDVRKKIIQVATYPVILVFFLIAIMVGLNKYLFEQNDSENYASFFVRNLPQIFFIGSVFISIVIICIFLYFKRKKSINNYQIIMKIPFISSIVQTYLTAYYAREWGNLIGQGIEMNSIVSLMQSQKNKLFSELGFEFSKRMEKGQEFSKQVESYSFFKRELALIIEYGEMKSKLGKELEIYSDECWNEFFIKIDRYLQLIQPVIFLFVALMIIMIYAAMLLPIYQNMEGFI
ncbi:competence type IV pilus assembly protein ComGB [Floricoccus penangensis]|uniref:competence type IV pilus assembly protein ComGB n=1 Tax=Floricoccus penangensis TaxID=1859475 RepID=UPI0020405685|nr:competence type IV pilus assembly protein ComGB [Floricoccus penangensis]URZ87458.1 type II secretion system F family protein [Floricoccus penangensis]